MASRCRCPPHRQRAPTRSRRSWNVANDDYVWDNALRFNKTAQQFVEMDPAQFLYLTLPRGKTYTDHLNPTAIREVEKLIDGDRDLDPAWLVVDISDGNTVIDHEGRHRAAAALRLGLRRIPVVIFVFGENGYIDLSHRPEARINLNRDALTPMFESRYDVQ